MEKIEIRLPKCLSEEERKGIQEYHSTLLEKFAPASRGVVSNMIYMFRDKEKMWPYQEYSPWQDTLPLIFEEGTVNKALDNALRKVLTLTQGGYEYGDIALFFSRAYAISLHALNNVDTGNTLKRYLAIWDTTTDTSCLTELWGIYFSQLPTPLCKDICASMVYCILGYENENRPEQLLQDIEWHLQASKNGTDTLKVFREEVASIVTEQTEGNTQDEDPKDTPLQEEEEPQADTPVTGEKEEEAPTDATKGAKNIPLLQFKEEAGLEKWAGVVNESIKDIDDRTLNSSTTNTMFAVMYYFASEWRIRKDVFKGKPTVTQIVHFFFSRCDFPQPKVTEKTIVNKMNELLNGDKKITDTDEIERVRGKIKKIIKENL